MKKGIKYILVICFLVTSHLAIAQNARQILDKTARVITSGGGATANFTIRGDHISSQGTILLKGNKFCAKTSMATIWYNGKTQWTYMKKTNEVNISIPDETKQAQMNPYKFITIYKTGYDMSLKKAKDSYIVHLTAQNKQRGIQELYVTINKSNYKPSLIRMKQGAQWITITISNMSNRPLSDGLFNFPSKDYPKAEIIDLR